MKPIHELVTTLGETYARPPPKSFGIQQFDRQFHLVIFGQTGTGKSSLLLQLMKQDLSNGRGFCLIDPHGDLAQSIHELAGENCIYWQPANPQCRYGYNPLTQVSDEYRSLVASGLIDTLKKQFKDSWGQRMEHLLRMVFLALLEQPNSTLLDIMPMFLDKSFRYQVLSNVTDEYVCSFWQHEFAKMNYKTATDGVAPIANKLGTFLAHPHVRKMLCEPEEPLRFRRIMDDDQNLIVNLSKGKLGADIANVIGGNRHIIGFLIVELIVIMSNILLITFP